MNINDLYQELILDHGTCPRNFTCLANANLHAEGYNPLCGDKITLFIATHNEIIVNATFQGHGCAISTASASIMTEILIGKTKKEALQILTDFMDTIMSKPSTAITLPKQLLALMGVKNYPSRVKCATLAWHALQSALTKRGSVDELGGSCSNNRD